MLYGCESWTLTKRDNSKINAIENKARRDRDKNVTNRKKEWIKNKTDTETTTRKSAEIVIWMFSVVLKDSIMDFPDKL